MTVLDDQVARLAGDVAPLVAAAGDQLAALRAAPAWRDPARVTLTGNGDSYAAALAAEWAFGGAATAVTAQRLVGYAGVAAGAGAGAGGELVVGVSASGRAGRVVEALAAARARGAATLAVTGCKDGPVAAAAGAALVWELADLEPGPGVRTFQAALLGLYGLAFALGGRDPAPLVAAAGAIGATAGAPITAVEAAAAVAASAPTLAVAGTGPGHGVAVYGAAKLVEAAGVAAHPQDLEEWWHVDRLVPPADLPLVVVAPPGRSHARARSLIADAAALGRRVVALAPAGSAAPPGILTLPVAGDLPEDLAPLAYHVPLARMAGRAAERLGRTPLRRGEPGFRPG